MQITLDIMVLIVSLIVVPFVVSVAANAAPPILSAWRSARIAQSAEKRRVGDAAELKDLQHLLLCPLQRELRLNRHSTSATQYGFMIVLITIIGTTLLLSLDIPPGLPATTRTTGIFLAGAWTLALYVWAISPGAALIEKLSRFEHYEAQYLRKYGVYPSGYSPSPQISLADHGVA
ncbi:hypothetical protein [Devosia beringensis]|uniref:hypothetical protein n=1 Tax=Devosia beringensis TaxID=2657486 RepID=UPI00186B7997|nr:hypothetical protein [Devosia beringensis]